MATFADDEKGGHPDSSFKEKHFNLLEGKIDNLGALGSVLITGVEREGSDDDDNDGADDEDDDYTEEDIKCLRHIIVTKNREKEIERSTIRFGGGGDFMAVFNTSTGNKTISDILKQVKKAMKKKSWTERFDTLFAMTYALNNFDAWMLDNELYGPGGECDKAIETLSRAWKEVMAHNDTELGIDSEFTRPGIIALLERFKKTIAEIPDQKYIFNWDGLCDGEEEEDIEEEEKHVEKYTGNDMELDDDDENSGEDSDEDSDFDKNDDYYSEEEVNYAALEGSDEDVPKEFLQRAMDAYSKCVVNIPEDSDSD